MSLFHQVKSNEEGWTKWKRTHYAPGPRRNTAILALNPNDISYDYSNGTGEISGWHSDSVAQPTKAEIDTLVAKFKAEWDAAEYSRNRENDYPDWGTQLNKIYDDGLTKWKSEMVDPVKAKWPKDNSGPV